MSEALNLLLLILDKRDYCTSEIVIQTKRGSALDFPYFREPEMIEEYQKILQDEQLVVINSREILEVIDGRYNAF